MCPHDYSMAVLGNYPLINKAYYKGHVGLGTCWSCHTKHYGVLSDISQSTINQFGVRHLHAASQ